MHRKRRYKVKLSRLNYIMTIGKMDYMINRIGLHQHNCIQWSRTIPDKSIIFFPNEFLKTGFTDTFKVLQVGSNNYFKTSLFKIDANSIEISTIIIEP